MTHLHSALAARVDEWRQAGCPCSAHPALAEVLDCATEDADSGQLRFLGKAQFRALQTYWCLRLALNSPKVPALYDMLFPDMESRSQVFSVTLADVPERKQDLVSRHYEIDPPPTGACLPIARISATRALAAWGGLSDEEDSANTSSGPLDTWCANVPNNQNCWYFDNNTCRSRGTFYQPSINQYSGTLTNAMSWSANAGARRSTDRFTGSTLSNSASNHDTSVNGSGTPCKPGGNPTHLAPRPTVDHDFAAAYRRSLAQDTATMSVLPADQRRAVFLTQS